MSPSAPGFAVLVQDYFRRHLVDERALSARTVESYRDALKLFLRFAQSRTGRPPEGLELADLDAPMVLAFLDHLESERRNCPRSRNARLAALRSFMRYASDRDPASLPIAGRVLAISGKRFDAPAIECLSRDEIDALLAAPDRGTFSGHRDAVMFALIYNTGARVSEVCDLRVADLSLAPHAAVQLRGKGRKQRLVPLWKSTLNALRDWLPRIDQAPGSPLFPNRDSRRMTRDGVENRFQRVLAAAAAVHPSLRARHVTPHTLRHATAIHMLQAGIDITVIALCLGHANTATTHAYVEADVETKRAALKRIETPSKSRTRFRPSDRVLTFLEGL